MLLRLDEGDERASMEHPLHQIVCVSDNLVRTKNCLLDERYAYIPARASDAYGTRTKLHSKNFERVQDEVKRTSNIR